jgi:hypothetical protein
MKKGLFIIAVLCYFTAASGVVVNSHYCMKRLVSTTIFGGKKNVCGRCGMKMHRSGGCCHDEVKVVKLQQDQNKFTANSYEIPALQQLVIVPSDFIVASFYNDGGQRHFHNHSPPLLSAQDTYKQINVFRI